MKVGVSEAKAMLTELVRRAEAGEEVILTRHGRPVVRFTPIKVAPNQESRRGLLESVRASGAAKATAGPSAARSQDFLYEEEGLPG